MEPKNLNRLIVLPFISNSLKINFLTLQIMKLTQQITFALLTCLACSLAPALSAQTEPAPLTETEDATLAADVTELVKQARAANPGLDLSDPVAVQQAIEALMAESYLLVPVPTAAEIQIIAETVMMAFMAEIQAEPGIDANSVIANVSSAILTATVAGLEAAAAAAPKAVALHLQLQPLPRPPPA